MHKKENALCVSATTQQKGVGLAIHAVSHTSAWHQGVMQPIQLPNIKKTSNAQSVINTKHSAIPTNPSIQPNNTEY